MARHWRIILAWIVHLYTALGVPLGVWAIFAAFAGDARTTWLLIWATIVVDSTDGILARKVGVLAALPSIDGRRLDDIVDYFCWVVVPIVVLVQGGLLPSWAAPAPLVASCYGFAQADAKTEDDYFLGFPSYWSLVGFYLVLFETPALLNGLLVLLVSVLVFVPLRYPYPTKTRPFRAVTLGLGTLWGLTMIALAALLPDPPRWLLWPTLLYPAYYLTLTVLLWRRRRVATQAQSGRLAR